MSYDGCRFAPQGESELECDKYRTLKNAICDRNLGEGSELGRYLDCFNDMKHEEEGTPRTKRIKYVDEAGTGNTQRLRRMPPSKS